MSLDRIRADFEEIARVLNQWLRRYTIVWDEPAV